jgi:transcriptional regulator with XRE-family HTH domain
MKGIFIDQIVSSIGDKIAHLRKQKNLSLNQLAEKAGVSVTTIHKLERSEMTPTVTVLMKIADALEEKVGYFLEDHNGTFEYVENIEYLPQKKGKVFRNTLGTTQIKYLALRLKGGKMLALLAHLKKGTQSSDKPKSHPGEEFIFCLQGEINYEIDGKVFSLKKGDTLHFFSTLPHRWEVVGDHGTKNLWVITPPPSGAVTELWK